MAERLFCIQSPKGDFLWGGVHDVADRVRGRFLGDGRYYVPADDSTWRGWEKKGWRVVPVRLVEVEEKG